MMARYIDADFLIEQLQDAKNSEWNKRDYSKSMSEMIEDFCIELSNTRQADVAEVKHGEWVTLEAEIGLYSCSLCGHRILRAECNYCPNCGAKMDVSEKEITTGGGKAE